MALPLSKQQLADWVLRQLGAPLVNIEIADVQIEDCIDEAIQWYQQWHYEGSNRAYRTIKVDKSLLQGNDRPNQPVNAPLWVSTYRYDSDKSSIYNSDGTTRLDVRKQPILPGRVIYQPNVNDPVVPGYNPQVQGARVWLRANTTYSDSDYDYVAADSELNFMSDCPYHGFAMFHSSRWDSDIVIADIPNKQQMVTTGNFYRNADGSYDSEYALVTLNPYTNLAEVTYHHVNRVSNQPTYTGAPPYDPNWVLEEVAIRDQNITLLPNGQVGVRIPKNIIGVTRVFRIDSFAQAGIYNYEYQYFLNNFDWFFGHGAANGGLTGYYIQKSYIELIDFMLNTQPAIRFNQHQGRLFLDIDWDRADRNLGSGTSFFLVEVQEASDPEVYPEVYQDMFVKQYTTQLVKRQWAQNLRKYSNAALPGNLQIDADRLWQEADQKIAEMQEDLRNNLQLELDTIIWG